MNQSKSHMCFSLRLILRSRISPDPHHTYLMIRRRQRCARKGESAQDPSGKTMTPWAFDVKFPRGTEFTFGSLTFAAGEDGDLKMLPPGPVPEHSAMAPSSALGGSCLGLDPCAGLYIYTAKLVRGIPAVTSILRPLVRASSSPSSASTPDHDSSNDYPEIGTNACGEPTEGSRLILMVVSNGDRSHNSSSSYPTIGRSEASDA
jgi:hypothetical protein